MTGFCKPGRNRTSKNFRSPAIKNLLINIPTISLFIPALDTTERHKSKSLNRKLGASTSSATGPEFLRKIFWFYCLIVNDHWKFWKLFIKFQQNFQYYIKNRFCIFHYPTFNLPFVRTFVEIRIWWSIFR